MHRLGVPVVPHTRIELLVNKHELIICSCSLFLNMCPGQKSQNIRLELGGRRNLTIRISISGHDGANTFSSLPLYLRNMSACSVDVFKRHLDNFLLKIPDTPHPPLPSYQTWPHYNKLEHRIPLYSRQNRGYSGTSCS
ncbi:hypothetical protein Pcinc_008410 [Petrolisthes cinctipes]|uniref:Uncharacterized protein n=1 Tax=Petrolisthes cinctipes TaxID=88211 RepID=A0AAE1KXB0_PETCI|nr:hypothetical protein Pcinc_008410 [Petrolisthes cinctipes]